MITIGALLGGRPERAPERPTIELAPKLSDAKLLTLAVTQALFGVTSEAWLQQAPPPRRMGNLRVSRVALRILLGARLALITTPLRLQVTFALLGATTYERDTAVEMIAFDGLDTAGRDPPARSLTAYDHLPLELVI